MNAENIKNNKEESMKENIKKRMEELKAKYKDTLVLGVDESEVNKLKKKGLVTAEDNPFVLEAVAKMEGKLKAKLRHEAECDPSFKQIIPYCLLMHSKTHEVFTTKRIGGDARLKDMHSIGLGGHMDEGEDFITCLKREIKEEVGLEGKDIDSIELYGYLYSDATEVDSVHFGILYIIKTSKDELKCLEENKLIGEWLKVPYLRVLRRNGKLESWSEMLFDSMFEDKEDTKLCMCGVCGKTALCRLRKSPYGPIRVAYCDECAKNGLEPYSLVVTSIASLANINVGMSEAYKADIRRLLKLWDRTGGELCQDVTDALKNLKAYERSPK